MIITTKYFLGDTIWFLFMADLRCEVIVGAETSTTKETGTKTSYMVETKNTIGQDVIGIVQEHQAFSSKDELITTITHRFYQSIESGHG